MDKRALKAGRWLTTNLDTGETLVVTRYTMLEARKRRDKFVKKHLNLCKEAYLCDHWHKGAQTMHGSKVVAKARKLLGYSPKTGSGDIFVLVMHAFQRSHKPKPVKGCDCGHCKNIRLFT